MADHPKDLGTIHRAFERWATDAPDLAAVRSGGEHLSYRELDARATALAHRLLAAGVGKDALVAVAIARSVDYVVGILGVLKAGGGYIPLDAEYPHERIQFMLADSGARAVLVTAQSAPPLDVPGGIGVIDIHEADGKTPAVPAVPTVSGASVAYVMYTSGSTGTPKGVAVSHSNVLSLVNGDERLAVAPGDRIAQLAPVSFDASTFEIWAALCRGGEVVIVPRASQSITSLGAALRATRPRWMFLTTGLFHLLAEHDIDALRCVGTLITGGDILSPAKVARAGRVTTTMAAYGPTETTTFASLHKHVAEAGGPVPIGTPLAAVTMRIVDDDLHVLADNVLGEIAIGGAGVARGYHRRSALTADRFRPDPAASPPGGRMYLTGDLGRRLTNGTFEFHGRRDRQVKVRGFRIELGEIESALTAHPDCAAAVAAALAAGGGEKRIVAYVALAKNAEAGLAELREWLANRLPPYAIPAKLVQLPEMPLDANGKTDRRQLPDPWTSRATLVGAAPFVEPRDALEADIAEVWADVLDLDLVGVTDDFFELGGDSLRSVNVLAQLGLRGIVLSAGELFGRASVRGCAELIRGRRDLAGPASSAPSWLREGED